MPVDVGADTAHTPTTSSGSDSGTSAPATADTQTSANPAATENGAVADAARTTSDTPPSRRSSSTNPNAIPQNTQPTPAGSPSGTTPPAPVDWQKRYSDSQSHWAREKQAMEQEQRRREGELTQLRQFQQQQQQQAERLKLKQWSKQHPEHQKFQGTLAKAAVIRQQLSNVDPKLPPEQQQALKDSIVSAMAPDEQQMLQEYQQESQSFQRDFFVDPRGTLAPILQQEIQAAFDQFRMHQQATQRIDKDFKELEPVIEAHRPELASMLQRGTPYDVAMENLRLKAQLDGLRNRAGEVENASMAAQEQQRLAKGKASITRDPVPASKPDVYTMAKKEATAKGISTDDSRFMGILSRIEANLKNTTPP